MPIEHYRQQPFHTMPPTRRSLLKSAIASITAATGLGQSPAYADRPNWSRMAFTLPELEEATEYSLGSHRGIKTDDVYLDIPDYIKSPGVVELSVSTSLPLVDAMALLVRANALPLAAVYKFPPDTEPFVTSRIDIFQSSEVIAVVRSAGKLFSNSRNVVISKMASPKFNELQDPYRDLYDPYDDLEVH